METQPGFSDSNQEIFERELEGIKSMFSPTCGILAKATFLISLKSKFNSPEISGTDFITDLVFSFDTNEIKKITNTYNSTETMSKDCLATATPLLSLINSCELEKILNEKEIVIQVIKYYLSIFSDSVLPFFNTEEKAELEKEQYISLETQFRKIIPREDQNSEIFIQDLRKLRFETYHLFHSVFNHCYNLLLHDSEDQKE
ncbi:hypothetical protein CWI39_0032p0060 [Hamiltosporidium magnivora]|uniref:Uncharacterized protein n=1 Tax=Hamiltosporidium magnivora TaxID=148818 RepID=A0A4Q9LQR1_9MICR|nr:hypothetical protein CWI39_0032p0060 [Hamiltosporidium magnivora]